MVSVAHYYCVYRILLIYSIEALCVIPPLPKPSLSYTLGAQVTSPSNVPKDDQTTPSPPLHAYTHTPPYASHTLHAHAQIASGKLATQPVESAQQATNDVPDADNDNEDILSASFDPTCLYAGQPIVRVAVREAPPINFVPNRWDVMPVLFK